MSENAAPENGSLPLSAAMLVEAACNRFEKAWREGRRPRIEDFLSSFQEAERPALLRELIALDIDYRRLAGEAPQPADYQARFPEVGSEWVADVATGPLPPLPQPVPAHCRPAAEDPAAASTRRFRCPHCHNPVQLADGQGEEVLCPGCGSAFKVRDARQTTTTQPMRQLGKFQLLERVGLGAFGAVWKARDTELDRIVALKIPHTGLLTAGDELERFQREARAAAQLRHPGIVTVHVVETLEGLPTIVADFIEGVPLREVLKVRRLSFREAAALVADVAEAVDFAHQKGLVHRDLKPANIMIEADRGAPGGLGRPLVMDFGLALRGEAEVTLTLDGQVLGTPAYMSPEQAAGKGHLSDARSDAYSLGVILYELLTGELPFRGSRVMLLHQVLHEEPRPPRKLNDKIPRDLETVCLKCLEKEPGRRYGTARALAEDLRRYLKGEPITARPSGAVERGWKWARRRPAAAGLLGLAAFMVVGLTAGGWWYSQQEHERAEREAKQKDAETERAARLQYAVDMTLAQRAWENHNLRQVLDLLSAQVPAPGKPDRRGWEWYYQQRLFLSDLHTLKGHTGRVYGVAFSPDGTCLASASGDNTVKVWDAASGQQLRTLKGHTSYVWSVAFSPDGTRLASASDDRTVKVWDAASGQELRTFKGHTSAVVSVAFSPDGTRLASASLDRTVKVWDAASGQELRTLKGHTSYVWSVAFSPDGTRLASASDDGTVKVWDAASGQKLRTLQGHTSAVYSVAFSPDGTRLASASNDGTVKVWDAASGRDVHPLKGHTSSVHSVAFSPDGTRLASGGDFTVKVWDAVSGQKLHTLQGHTDRVWSVAFSLDGTRLASASEDFTVKVWDAVSGQKLRPLQGHTHNVYSVAFSPDGTRLASASWDRTVKVWDAVSGQELRTLQGHTDRVSSVAFSPDGTCLASASGDNTVKVWDAASGQELRTFQGHTDRVSSVAFSPDGTRLASASGDNTVKVWDAASGQELRTLQGHTSAVWSVAFSPDGTRLACGFKDGMAAIYDARPLTPQLRVELEARGLVEEFCARWLLQSDVVKAVQRTTGITEEVREAALRFAHQRPDKPEILNDRSWSIVRAPGAAPERYRQALRGAEAACELQPVDGAMLNTLGVAQYRVGRYQDALATLTQAEPLNAKQYQGPFPGDLAFLAMAHYQLGQKDQALTALSRLRERMKDRRWANEAESQAFLREAEALVQGTMACAEP